MSAVAADEIRLGLRVLVPLNTAGSQYAEGEIVWVSTDKRVVEVRRGKRKERSSCAASRLRRV